MRRAEIEKGVNVVNPDNPNQVIGKSQAAAKKAVLETAISRVVFSSTIILPSLGFFILEKTHMMPQQLFWKTCIQILFCYFEATISVPITLGCFP